MKNLLLILVLIGSIVGLIFIQINLLKVGVLLEKRQFDQRMELVLNRANYELDRNTNMADLITQIYQIRNTSLAVKEEKALLVKDSISDLLREELENQGLKLAFSFAIWDKRESSILLSSTKFDGKAFGYEQFRRTLRRRIPRECNCELALLVNVDNLFSYLLGQLAYLIIPTIICMLLLLTAVFVLLITNRRQQRLDRLKNDFINNLTHELKTPVFSISLLTKVMREAIGGQHFQKLGAYLNLLEKENQQLKGHIDKVLELASLESGRYQLDRKEQDVQALLEAVIGHFEAKTEDREGELTKDFSAGTVYLSVDKLHFENAIQNLLENALKYSKSPYEIKVDTTKEGNQFVISIADNGIGIAPSDQQQIFNKFYRVSSGNLHAVKGFGLGLSYVKQIVEAHGGAINVKSQLGKGSTFYLSFPIL